MPVYFFDFDGVVDQSDGIEFNNSLEAYKDARRAVAETLEELTIDSQHLNPLRCHCIIRDIKGNVIGCIRADTAEERYWNSEGHERAADVVIARQIERRPHIYPPDDDCYRDVDVGRMPSTQIASRE